MPADKSQVHVRNAYKRSKSISEIQHFFTYPSKDEITDKQLIIQIE